MKPSIRTLLVALELFAFSNLHLSTAFAQGTTAFSYNGTLSDGGGPANGSYDVLFVLCDAPTNGNIIGTVTNSSTAVSNGLFITILDFGNVFTGPPFWLELAVRTNAGTNFTALSPRQPILPFPYALYAAHSGTALIAGTATNAMSFSGPLVGDVTGMQGATVVASVGGQSAASVAS